MKWMSNSEAFATSAGAGCIGILEEKTLTVQPVGIVKFSIDEVEKAFQIRYQFNVAGFKNLVGRL
jgi:hypothetical protein